MQGYEPFLDATGTTVIPYFQVILLTDLHSLRARPDFGRSGFKSKLQRPSPSQNILVDNMAPRVSIHLTARDGQSGDQSGLNPIIIAGIVVAAVIAAGLAIWLAIHWYRKRAAARRNARRGSAFVNFGGFDNASGSGEKAPLPGYVVILPVV